MGEGSIPARLGEEMVVEIFLPEDLRRYVEEHVGPVPPLLEGLERETRKSTDSPGMVTGKDEGAFLKLLGRLAGATRGRCAEYPTGASISCSSTPTRSAILFIMRSASGSFEAGG